VRAQVKVVVCAAAAASDQSLRLFASASLFWNILNRAVRGRHIYACCLLRRRRRRRDAVGPSDSVRLISKPRLSRAAAASLFCSQQRGANVYFCKTK
jgi:hypothetical protein